MSTKIVSINESELKNVLTKITSGEQAWPQENEIQLIQSMIKHIGSADAELRDQLIYATFFRVIIEKRIEPRLLTNLLETCLSENFLFKEIGEQETDSVFTRSFTTLVIALVLHQDINDGFLSEQKVKEVKDKLILYIRNEQDLRGFVPEKGWAHSIAHVADAFEELIKNQYIGQSDYPDILNALWDKVFVSRSVYIHDEDERILNPIFEMLQNGLNPEEIDCLIEGIPKELKKQKEQLEEADYWVLYANCKKFLKTFYLKLNQHQGYLTLQKRVENCLSKI